MFKDLEKIYEIVNSYPDYYIVIISTSYLDDSLLILLDFFLNNNCKLYKKLLPGLSNKNFSQKIELAKDLKLLSNKIFDDLTNIRRIRNIFAHSRKRMTLYEANVLKYIKRLKSHIPSTPPHERAFPKKLNKEGKERIANIYKQTVLNIAHKLSADYYTYKILS